MRIKDKSLFDMDEDEQYAAMFMDALDPSTLERDRDGLTRDLVAHLRKSRVRMCETEKRAVADREAKIEQASKPRSHLTDSGGKKLVSRGMSRRTMIAIIATLLKRTNAGAPDDEVFCVITDEQIESMGKIAVLSSWDEDKNALVLKIGSPRPVVLAPSLDVFRMWCSQNGLDTKKMEFFPEHRYMDAAARASRGKVDLHVVGHGTVSLGVGAPVGCKVYRHPLPTT